MELFVPISIVIRTFNSEKTLNLVVEKLSLQKGDDLIFVDSGSTDKTREIALNYRANFCVLNESFHFSKALNIGFLNAKNDWVLVISSHCIPLQSNFLEVFRKFIRNCDSKCVVGYGLVGVFPPKINGSYLEGNLANFNSGLYYPGGNALAIYRKSAWSLHHFSESIPTAEDLEWFLWAVSVGFTTRTIPIASAVSVNKGSYVYMFRKGFRELRQAALLLRSSKRSYFQSILTLLVSSSFFLIMFFSFKISFGVMVRQICHRAGAFFGEVFPIK